MTIYAYRCDSCRVNVDSTRRGDDLGICPSCNSGTLKRRWQVSMQPGMEEHFNHTVGKPISSMTQFKSELARKSEEYSERTGIPSDFQPREWGEMGATGEGLDATNKVRVDSGLPALKVPKSG